MSVGPTLTTERLILRPFRAEDFDAYAAIWADPIVMRYITGTPMSREDSWSRALRWIGLWQHMGFGFLMVEEKATGTLLGEVGFQERRRDLTPSIEGTLETGWGLIPAAQGKGYATEAMAAALAWADAAFPGMRYTALIDAQNLASVRVAAKSGFREFARTEYHGAPVILHERSTETNPND